MTNPQSLRAATAYAVDMSLHGLYGQPSSPYHRVSTLWARMRTAAANLRGDHHGAYPWYAAVHHLTRATESAAYHSHAWTLGVYTSEEFMVRARQESIDRTLPGALIVSQAYASRETFVAAEHKEVFALPFQRFAQTRIPRQGVWVLVVYDVEQPEATPEIVWHEYSVTDVEISAMQATVTGNALLPLALGTAHHVHHLRALDIDMPRLLLRLRPCAARAGWLELSSAAVEITLRRGLYTQHAASELGDTTLSARIGLVADTDRDAVRRGLDKVKEKHRVARLDGYYTTPDGQFQLGEPGLQPRIASQATAVVAFQLAIRQIIAENFALIAGQLDKFQSDWRNAGDDDATAVSRARLGVEALFAVLAPGGRDSPVLVELKRIFGDKGIPTLKKMLSTVATGLPHAAPVSANLNAKLQAVLASKVDMDAGRGPLISEQYMAEALRGVTRPDWTAGKSPLALSLLVSAMPDDFVQRVITVLRTTMDMPNSVLKHAGVPVPAGEPSVEWTKRAEPGVYVLAPLDNYDRAARALLVVGKAVIGAVGLKDVAGAEKLIAAINANPNAEFEARELELCAVSAAASVAIVQADAINAANQSQKIKFNAAQMHMVACIKDVLPDGSSFVMLVHAAGAQTAVARFEVVPDHRMPFVRDLVGALVSRIGANYGGGPAVVAAVQELVATARAISAYAAEPPATASDQPAPAEENVPYMLQLLRNWARSTSFVAVSGAMDGGEMRIKEVGDKRVRFAIQSADGIEREFDAPVDSANDLIGSPTMSVRPAELRINVGNTSQKMRAIAIGAHLYAERGSLATLVAAQNLGMQSVAGPTDELLHDPYDLASAPRLLHPSQISSTGERVRVIKECSHLVPNHVGGKDVRGMVMSPQERCDMSVYNSGLGLATNEWYSPFA